MSRGRPLGWPNHQDSHGLASPFDGSGSVAGLDRGGEPLESPRRRLIASPSALSALDTLLFHKPFGVLSQFSPEPASRWGCLGDWISFPGVYPAGRLDADSEGLLLLTADGRLQQRLTDPRWGHRRTYWVQVEGEVKEDALAGLRNGLVIQGRRTLPAEARLLADPGLAERQPPIRERRSIPTAWLEISLREGRNRQIRRMTAAVGLPTLRLVRVSIDLLDRQPPLGLEGLAPGQWRRPTDSEAERLGRLLSRPARSGQRTGGIRSGPR